MNLNRHSDGARWGWLPAAVVIILAVVLVFGQTVNYQFLHWDDNVNVWQNARLNPVSPGNVLYFWGHSYARMYAPLSYTFFAAEALISPRGETPPSLPFGPLQPTVFHIGSLALHGGCCLLVLLILRRLIRQEVAALAGALLFALHPLQVESVAWITETRGLLAAFFGLAAIWQYLQYNDEAIDDSRRRLMHYLLASLALLLALLSKPTAVAIPLIVLVIDWGFCRRPLRQVVAALAPWVVFALLFSIGTAMVQPVTSIETAPLWARPLLALDALSHYLVKLLLPFRLGPDYGHSPSVAMQKELWYAMGVVPLGLAFLAWSLPNRRVWLTALGVFAVALLPMSGLISFDFQRISTVADRYVYLAMLGPAMALAWFLVRHGSVSRYAMVAVALILYGVASYQQTGHWATDLRLAYQALRVNNQSFTFQLADGNAWYRADEFENAIMHYNHAREIHEESLMPLYNMARAKFQQGNMAGAVENIEAVIKSQPNYARGDAYVLLGQALMRSGKYADARAAFETVLNNKKSSERALDGALNGLAKLDALQRP